MNQETGKTHMPALLAGIVMAFVFACVLTGCTRTAGWEAKVGVYPINEVQDKRSLGHLGEGFGK